jgi:hypothetical protein
MWDSLAGGASRKASLNEKPSQKVRRAQQATHETPFDPRSFPTGQQSSQVFNGFKRLREG